MTSQPPIVRALLVAGASHDSKDRLGNTALHLASERGDIDCVRALLQPVTVAETSSAGLRYSMAGAAPGHSYLEERNYDGEC
jgi:ankyrin repeat protein